MRKRILGGVLLLAALLLAACSADKGKEDFPPEPEDGVLIYAALNPVSYEVEQSISRFNEAHGDIQIEVRDYSDEGGPQRLLVELAAGRVPDIMELQRIGREDLPSVADVEALWSTSPLDADQSGSWWMPYRRLAQKGYLEDLWPYIENDPDFGREGVLEAPLKAAEIDGGLYMLFREVSVNTLVGAESVVGSRRGWTVGELMDAFSAMPPDSTILHYDTVQNKVFFALIGPTLSRFVDWETGECSFDDGNFRSIIAFLKCFPTSFESNLSPEDLKKEVALRQMDGMQMLESTEIGMLRDIPYYNGYFRGEASYIGYPTADGGGNGGSAFLLHGNKLAMSSSCQDKEAAWEFIRQLIQRSGYRSKNAMAEAHSMEEVKIRINRQDYELGNTVDLQMKETRRPVFLGGPWVDVLPPTEDELRLFEELINTTSQIYWPDDALSNIVWEAVSPYLSGDKTLDDTLRLLDNRVSLYLNEQK